MPRDPKLIWKDVIYILPRAEILTVAAKIKLLALISPEVAAQARLYIEGVNNLFSNQTGISGLWETEWSNRMGGGG